MADETKRCKDEGDRPGCLGVADERYTMDFGDVEPGAKVYWCAYCGPEAHAMAEVMAAKLNDPVTGKLFAEELEREIEKVEN